MFHKVTEYLSTPDDCKMSCFYLWRVSLGLWNHIMLTNTGKKLLFSISKLSFVFMLVVLLVVQSWNIMSLKRISCSVSVIIRLCTFLKEVHLVAEGACLWKCRGFQKGLHLIWLFYLLLIQVICKLLCRQTLKCSVHY